jgi:hypothetical protein
MERIDEWIATAEASWRWVLSQVHVAPDGPVLVRDEGASAESVVPAERDSIYDGLGGLALALAEIRLSRPWSTDESRLAEAIVDRLQRLAPDRREPALFCGLAGDAVALRTLAPGSERVAVERLAAIATPDGWTTTLFSSGGSISDLLLGNAGVVLTGLWAGGDLGAQIAGIGCAALVRSAHTATAGVSWQMHPEVPELMPNFSHGNAGIATALALAGAALHQQEWIDVAVAGAEFMLSVATVDEDGLHVPHYLPRVGDEDEFTFTWCHGPVGTSSMFLALEAAGVAAISGRTPLEWHTRSLDTLTNSGLPARRHPGFWDNDGRCCGTAGVGDVFLDDAALHIDNGRATSSSAFAASLTDTLVERAVRDDAGVRWQFIEHRKTPPLLPAGTGWMQGAAGIAAYLFRAARVMRAGPDAPSVSTPLGLPLEWVLGRIASMGGSRHGGGGAMGG